MIESGLSAGIMTSLFFLFSQAAVVPRSLLPQPVMAQLVLGTGGLPLILGIVMIVGGGALFFVRNFRPQLARDQDIALSVVAVVAGFILVLTGWRLDPAQTLGVYLLAGLGGFFAVETLRLRGATVEQAKRTGGGGRVVDEERPVSRVYRAELDDQERLEERPNNRRIRSQRDYRSASASDSGYDEADYGSDRRSRPSLRGSSDRTGSASARRRPSSTRSEGRSAGGTGKDYWQEDVRGSRDSWGEEDNASWSGASDRPGQPNYSQDYDRQDYDRQDYDTPKRSRRSRSDSDSPRRGYDADNADYVDFQPIEYPEEDGGSAGYDR